MIDFESETCSTQTLKELFDNESIITYCIGKGGFGYVCLCLCVCWPESVRILFYVAPREWRH